MRESFRPINPHGQISGDQLGRLAGQVARQSRLRATGGLDLAQTYAGNTLSRPYRQKTVARLTDFDFETGRYAWTQQIDERQGPNFLTYTDGMSGDFTHLPAYEVNSKIVPYGELVELEPGLSNSQQYGEYMLFDHCCSYPPCGPNTLDACLVAPGCSYPQGAARLNYAQGVLTTPDGTFFFARLKPALGGPCCWFGVDGTGTWGVVLCSRGPNPSFGDPTIVGDGSYNHSAYYDPATNYCGASLPGASTQTLLLMDYTCDPWQLNFQGVTLVGVNTYAADPTVTATLSR